MKVTCDEAVRLVVLSGDLLLDPPKFKAGRRTEGSRR